MSKRMRMSLDRLVSGWRWAIVGLVLFPLVGCSVMESPGSRIGLLVLLPALVIVVGMVLLSRRSGRPPSGRRHKGYPDYEHRD